MRPLRILHVTPYYEHAWAYGGIPRVVAALATEQSRRGHDVTVCTTDAMASSARLPRVETSAVVDDGHGVTVRVFPNLSNTLAYHWQLFLPRGLSPYLRNHARQFDVAHLHACHNLPGAITTKHLARAGVPCVLSPHGTAPRIERRQFAKWLFDLSVGRNVMKNASRVLAVSEAERRQFHAMGVTDDRIATIPNPLDLREFETPISRGAFRRAHHLGDAPLVMYLGKLTPRKRLDVLAEAFARVNRPDARLVIAGNDMGYERDLRALLDRLGLAARTAFTGLLPGHERLEALADADVVSYASKDEIFGLVPLESILCGTPVVVAGDSGCGEVITAVGGGLVVPEGDANALSEAIRQLLEAPAAWRERARTAQPDVRARFSAGTVCERLDTVYRDVIGSRSMTF